MKTLEYMIPTIARERTWNYKVPMELVVNAYLRGLTDAEIANVVEETNHGGKGAGSFPVTIRLRDETKANIIDNTLRTMYGAISPKEYHKLSEREYYRFMGREDSLDRRIARENELKTFRGKIKATLRRRGWI